VTHGQRQLHEDLIRIYEQPLMVMDANVANLTY